MTYASPLPGGDKLMRRNEFEHSPLLAYYEVTHLRDPAGREGQGAGGHELDTQQAMALIAQLCTFAKPPMLVITGGDPFQRPDLAQLVQFAHQQGLKVSIAPSAAPHVTRERLADLKASGLTRLCVALDGATADAHDHLRGELGGYTRAMRLIDDAAAIGLPVQVNTTLSRRNVEQIDDMADLLAGLKIIMWSVSFFIPQDASAADERIAGDVMERIFARLWEHSQYQPYAIKVHDAPHYRRYVQRDLELRGDDDNPIRTAARYGSEVGTNDGKGVVYISASGEIFPSACLPIRCGQFPNDSVVSVYRDNELFRALRNEDGIGGKCGICRYRALCGGSRARAYALTGDPLAAEPDCHGGFPDCRKDEVC